MHQEKIIKDKNDIFYCTLEDLSLSFLNTSNSCLAQRTTYFMRGKNSGFPFINFHEIQETVKWRTSPMECWIFGSYLPWESHFRHHTHTSLMKVNHHYWRSPNLYFRNQLRIFINRKEKLSGSFPPTAMPAQQILAFSVQKSTPNWKMASELILPVSQVSCIFQLFQTAWLWPCLCFSLLPKTHSARQVLLSLVSLRCPLGT